MFLSEASGKLGLKFPGRGRGNGEVGGGAGNNPHTSQPLSPPVLLTPSTQGTQVSW